MGERSRLPSFAPAIAERPQGEALGKDGALPVTSRWVTRSSPAELLAGASGSMAAAMEAASSEVSAPIIDRAAMTAPDTALLTPAVEETIARLRAHQVRALAPVCLRKTDGL
jgi:hypothetical protein